MKQLSKRHYLVGLSFVLTLNVALLIFLINAVFAQVTAKPAQVKAAITVEVGNRPDSPLLVSLIGVDATSEQFQKINFTVQSLSEKSIRGYVLATADGKTSGKTTVTFFPAKPLSKGGVHNEVLVIENENIKPSTKLTLFIDYVSYTDRTDWGGDERKMSNSISGMITGAFFASSEFDGMIKNDPGLANLDAILAKPLAEIDVAIPATAENQSEAWQRGFRSGYKGFVSYIKNRRTEPDFESQLEEFRRILQQERRDK